jgi:predicted nucleotidyltransferase
MDFRLEQAILDCLRNQPNIVLAIVFGSVAAGRARADSDLDIAVGTGRPLTVSDKITLIAELAQRTGRPIDLVDIHKAGEPLLGQILRHGKILISDEMGLAALIRRHVFDAADFLPYRNRILTERRLAWIGK